MSREARVGLVTFVAFAVVVAVVIFLRGTQLLGARGYPVHVVFDDAGGIGVGAPVRMAGVSVGRVDRIELDPTNRARLTLTIDAGVQIREGSRFLIASAGFLGDRFVSITPAVGEAPPLPAGAEVKGDAGFSIDRLAERFEAIADRVEQLVDNVNRIAGDPTFTDSVRRTLRNVEETSAVARTAAANFEATTRRLQAIVDAEGKALARDLRQMSGMLVATAAELNRFVRDAAGDGTLARDVRETAAALRATSQRVERMAAQLERVVNEQNIRTVNEAIVDARQAVAEARALIRRAGPILDRVGGAVERFGGILGPGGEVPAIRSLLRFGYEVWYAGQHVGHGFDLVIFPEANRFYRLGVDDIGGMNGFALQVGQRFNTSLAWRAGVFQSQLGIGIDYLISPRLTLSADLYNPNALALDARLRYQLDSRWRIILGGTNLMRQPSLLLGVGTSF